MPLILYTLFFISLIPIVLAWIGGVCRVKQFGRLDNHHPRQQQSDMTGFGARVQAAQANGWEALAIYTATVVIAYASGIDMYALDIPALLFLTLRLIYSVTYMANLAWVRSVVFVAGMGCCFYIIYLSHQINL